MPALSRLVIASHVDEDVVIALKGPGPAVPSVWCAYWPRQKAAQVATTLTGTQRIVAANCVIVPVIRCSTSKAGYSANQRQSTAREQWRSMAGGPANSIRATVLSGCRTSKTVYH